MFLFKVLCFQNYLSKGSSFLLISFLLGISQVVFGLDSLNTGFYIYKTVNCFAFLYLNNYRIQWEALENIIFYRKERKVGKKNRQDYFWPKKIWKCKHTHIHTHLQQTHSKFTPKIQLQNSKSKIQIRNYLI